MQITLDLRLDCIQTAVRRKYNRLISTYFKLRPADNSTPLESEITLLKKALENLDFGWLRATYPELRGGGTHDIVMATGANNKITISINGRIINATHQNHELL